MGRSIFFPVSKRFVCYAFIRLIVDRSDANSPWQAEELLTDSHPDKEYLPITGLPEFTKLAAKLAYGEDSVPLKQNTVIS